MSIDDEPPMDKGEYPLDVYGKLHNEWKLWSEWRRPAFTFSEAFRMLMMLIEAAVDLNERLEKIERTHKEGDTK